MIIKSLIRQVFYVIKPAIPRWLQLYLRRKMVVKQREKYKSVWPILEAAKQPPAGWKGWPDGKDFAFILTHDVEHRKGHDKVLQLLMLEKELGFVSSFNFVPERYKVDEDLRNRISAEGFEVGVHGLTHDGKLFRNKNIFNQRAPKINKYLQEWNSVGFRAPAMHHNLEWIAELNLQYDLSTFDTDPFEPQSDGVGTIFPFIYRSKRNNNAFYVELPYTLVQDFTLLVLMKEKDCSIWKKKLDWIAANKGMALLNVHPDYVNFDNHSSFENFPVGIYRDFLLYVKNQYSGKYWNALPREAARYAARVFNNDNSFS